MPKTKGQGVVFGVLMSVIMAYAMEVYNVAIKMGFTLKAGGLSNMTNSVFLEALKEASYMWIFVFVFSSLFGNRVGHKLAAKVTDPEKDNPFFITIMVSCCTVLIMCPVMSLTASVLFNVILAHQPLKNLPAIWVGTVIKNFPMALLWNLFAAGPLTRLIFRKIFKKQLLREETKNEK